jgi:hypothetical protein
VTDANGQSGRPAISVADVGAYCRDVEDHLTRVNGGHLVRIVGPGFDLVRQWAEEGIPIRVVFRGIDRKVERHHAGHSTRPLRIEFCAGDVREEYDYWRRAVGVTTGYVPAVDDADAGGNVEESRSERKKPSLGKHLDRVLERLGRAVGRLDLPDTLRDGLGAAIAELGAMRDMKAARGPEREERAARLSTMDRELLTMVRNTCPADVIAGARRDAERDLAPYRDRLSGDAWTRAVDATVDHLLRDRLSLPTIEL